jgi:hypothetical protein
VQVRLIRVILIGAVLAGGSCSMLHAQDARMTDGEACTVLLRSFFPTLNPDSYLGQGRRPIIGAWLTGGEPTPSGIRFLQSTDKDIIGDASYCGAGA